MPDPRPTGAPTPLPPSRGAARGGRSGDERGRGFYPPKITSKPPHIMRLPSKGMSMVWKRGSSIIFVQAASAVALKRLDDGFFRVRFDRLTPREKDYMRAMAELGPGPHRSGDVAKTLGISVSTAAPLRSGLIAKGMIFSPQHGDTAFTVPMFDEFMKRAIPNFNRSKK